MTSTPANDTLARSAAASARQQTAHSAVTTGRAASVSSAAHVPVRRCLRCRARFAPAHQFNFLCPCCRELNRITASPAVLHRLAVPC
jgi:hypothetical protein